MFQNFPLFLLFSALFLSLIKYEKSYTPAGFSYQRTSFNFKAIDQVKNKKLRSLGEALIYGKKTLPKELKTKFSNLQSFHLITPSGLHLSSLFLVFKIFQFHPLVHLWSSWLSRFLSLGILFFAPTSFFALKRAGLLFLLKSFFQLKMETCLIMAFIIEMAFGSFAQIMSLSVSFLFLGTLLSLRKCSPLIKVSGLWTSQSLLAIIFDQQVFLVSFILCSVLSCFFALLFPFLILMVFINWSEGLEVILKVLWILLDSFNYFTELLSLKVDPLMTFLIFLSVVIGKQKFIKAYPLIMIGPLW